MFDIAGTKPGDINLFFIDAHLKEMRNAVKDMKDPSEAAFFKAHLQGMEDLAERNRTWLAMEPGPMKDAEAGEIEKTIKLLLESLDVLAGK